MKLRRMIGIATLAFTVYRGWRTVRHRTRANVKTARVGTKRALRRMARAL